MTQTDRQSVTILSLWSPGLDPRSVCMRFVVYKVTLRQAFLQVLKFSMSLSFHHCSILIHSICNQHWQSKQLIALLNNMLRKRIPVCILTPCFFKIHFNIILLSLPVFKRFCSLRSSDQNTCGTLRMYTIVTLPTVLYVCETWFVLLREKHSLGNVQEESVVGNIWNWVEGGYRRFQKTAEWKVPSWLFKNN